ncbi:MULTISPECIES: helix-turn-helix domain-containing protein [unclassified Streptomyces]|uniref:helix-turn-helix domain-containing protein n=1 Tax=unclassified Streptomyces TaxID=2593676 RepID=UPI001EF119B1|nr:MULTISPECIES: helix-turn-helix domain-containing protein [unclassified Streptomyces]
MTDQRPVRGDREVPTTPEALRKRYEAGSTVQELARISGLSHGTVINRLRSAGTVMRTSWQTRRMRQPPARRRLAAHLRRLYEQHGATLAELAAAGGKSKRAARQLLIEAGGKPRTAQETLRIRSASKTAERIKLMTVLRTKYEAGASVSALAAEHNLSTGTVYRLLHQAKTSMRPRSPAGQRQHRTAR